MKPRSCKAKGQRFVAELADEIRTALGLHEYDCRPTPSGVNGEDLWLSPEAIKSFPFAVECKNVESLNIWGAMRQAISHAIGTRRYPLVIFRRNHSETYCALHLEDLLTLLKQALETRKFEGFEKPLDPV